MHLIFLYSILNEEIFAFLNKIVNYNFKRNNVVYLYKAPDDINTELLQHAETKTKEELFKLIHDILTYIHQ